MVYARYLYTVEIIAPWKMELTGGLVGNNVWEHFLLLTAEDFGVLCVCYASNLIKACIFRKREEKLSRTDNFEYCVKQSSVSYMLCQKIFKGLLLQEFVKKLGGFVLRG